MESTYSIAYPILLTCFFSIFLYRWVIKLANLLHLYYGWTMRSICTLMTSSKQEPSLVIPSQGLVNNIKSEKLEKFCLISLIIYNLSSVLFLQVWWQELCHSRKCLYSCPRMIFQIRPHPPSRWNFHPRGVLYNPPPPPPLEFPIVLLVA